MPTTVEPRAATALYSSILCNKRDIIRVFVHCMWMSIVNDGEFVDFEQFTYSAFELR